ncbi:hypothetical protein Tco_1164440 [Tanacetum coccineum]
MKVVYCRIEMSHRYAFVSRTKTGRKTVGARVPGVLVDRETYEGDNVSSRKGFQEAPSAAGSLASPGGMRHGSSEEVRVQLSRTCCESIVNGNSCGSGSRLNPFKIGTSPKVHQRRFDNFLGLAGYIEALPDWEARFRRILRQLRRKGFGRCIDAGERKVISYEFTTVEDSMRKTTQTHDLELGCSGIALSDLGGHYLLRNQVWKGERSRLDNIGQDAVTEKGVVTIGMGICPSGVDAIPQTDVAESGEHSKTLEDMLRACAIDFVEREGGVSEVVDKSSNAYEVSHLGHGGLLYVCKGDVGVEPSSVGTPKESEVLEVHVGALRRPIDRKEISHRSFVSEDPRRIVSSGFGIGSIEERLV